METAVRKATRLDYNPPKQKHLQTLINSTFQSPRHAADIIDLLEKRLKENSWIIIFKVLITIHTLMRLGDGEKIIIYVETRPSALDTSRLREKSSGVVHIQNIYLYTSYLEQKVIAFRQLKYDYVKNTMGSKVGKLRRLSVKDGLLKETIILQKQIGSLLKCNFILDDVDNNISLYAFRLLTEDLLVLFQVINESIVNILEHYFAMEKADARTSLEIYKRFAKQTEDTISFLDRARRLQHELHISIPEVKHAPLSLATALEEYLDDSNPQPQKQTTTVQQPTTSTTSPTTNNNTFSQQPQQQQQQPKELIDFFASLENEKVNIFYNPVQQPQQQIPMFSAPVVNTTPMVNAQPTGHNPFRSNTMDSSMQQLALMPPSSQSFVPSTSQSFMPQSPQSFLPQPSNLSALAPQSSLVPQASTSSVLPTNSQSNPFRSSTMPQMSFSSPNNNNWLMQPSVSTSHNPFSGTPMNTTAPTNNNPFAPSGQPQPQPQFSSSIF